MTIAARRVLTDCEAALQMLEDERNDQRWRVLWFGAVALLRAVGHVLRSVDGEVHQQRAAIDAAYERWKSGCSKHAIFREFIEEERNNILKEYRSNVLDSAEVLLTIEVQKANTRNGVDETTFVIDENLFRPLIVGYGMGEDARDIYRMAIEWWDTELSCVEEDYSNSE